MKTLTDLFIRRPVLALVVNLVIVIAGLQAIRCVVGHGLPGHGMLERNDAVPLSVWGARDNPQAGQRQH